MVAAAECADDEQPVITVLNGEVNIYLPGGTCVITRDYDNLTRIIEALQHKRAEIAANWLSSQLSL